jgi:hypothetical protein
MEVFNRELRETKGNQIFFTFGGQFPESENNGVEFRNISFQTSICTTLTAPLTCYIPPYYQEVAPNTHN